MLFESQRESPFASNSLRLLNALNSEDRGLKVRFSLATIAFRESAQMSQILSSQGKNADPKGPKIEKIQSRLKISISLENFNLEIEIFNPDLQNSPQKIGVYWVSRLTFSIEIENFNPGGRS